MVRDGGRVSETKGAVLIFEEGSFLGGNGLLQISVTNSGTIKPGGAMANNGWYDVTSGAGTLTVTGRVDFTESGRLEAELGGAQPTDHDRLDVSQAVVLDGTLSVSLIHGFEPAASDSFTLMTFSDRNDTVFETVVLPPLSGGLDWDLSYSNTAVILSVKPPPGTVLLVR